MPRNTAGGIILGADGKIVIVFQNGNSWAFPKGGIDPGESVLDAAWREVKEETGLSALDLMLVGELGSYMRRSIGITGQGENMDLPESTRTLFLFKTQKTELAPEDTEVTEARWATVDEALNMLTHPKDAEFLRSVRDKIK